MKILWQMDQPVDPGLTTLMQTAADCAVLTEGVAQPCAVSVRLCDDEAIHAINREYRQVDRATDVLSFPSTDCTPEKTLGSCEKKLLRERDETGRCFLGDIIISLPRAKEQAQEYGHSLKRELAYLTAHALFHLMGYDHMQP